MSEWESETESVSILGLAVIVFWYVAIVISCIMVAGYISNKVFHLDGMYWWYSSIVIFAILSKIIFFDTTKSYNKILGKGDK